MCGIFGGIGRGSHLVAHAKTLSRFARQRGRDSSGIVLHSQDSYAVHRADFGIRRLISGIKFSGTSVIAGHSRLITQGLTDNQPVIRDNFVVFHNGIVLNTPEIWDKLGAEPQLEIDTEVIPAIAHYVLSNGGAPEDIPETVLELAEGVVNCVMVIPRLGKLLLFSNNGSLFTGVTQKNLFFSSEEFPLKQISCSEISQVEKPLFFDVPISEKSFEIVDHRWRRHDLVPILPQRSSEENLLGIPSRHLLRCTRCELPETMPYISFDSEGVCNYCHSDTKRNARRPLAELDALLKPYRRENGGDCIVPFSGGRDSSFGLHVAVHDLGLKPVAYTYDWGMVTDLGRRNISRMCSVLGG